MHIASFPVPHPASCCLQYALPCSASDGKLGKGLGTRLVCTLQSSNVTAWYSCCSTSLTAWHTVVILTRSYIVCIVYLICNMFIPCSSYVDVWNHHCSLGSDSGWDPTCHSYNSNISAVHRYYIFGYFHPSNTVQMLAWFMNVFPIRLVEWFVHCYMWPICICMI